MVRKRTLYSPVSIYGNTRSRFHAGFSIIFVGILSDYWVILFLLRIGISQVRLELATLAGNTLRV